MPLTKSPDKSMLQLAIGGMLLGTIGIFIANAGQPPLITVFFRCFFGCIALGLWLLCSGKVLELKVSSSCLIAASITGALMVCIWWLYFVSLNYISVGLSTLVFHLQPFWLLLLSSLFLKEVITLKTVVVLLAALSGLTLATGIFNDTDTMLVEHVQWGILLCLLGSVLYAFATLLAKTASGISPIAFAWWQCLVGTLLTCGSLLYGVLPAAHGAWIWLAGIGVIHSGLAFTLIYQGMSGLTTDRVAVLQFIYPSTALIVDWFYFGHLFSLSQWIGTLILGGALWSLRRA